LARLLPLCLIAGVLAVRTSLRAWHVRVFFWNKIPYFWILFLDLRFYSSTEQSAFSGYSKAVAASTPFAAASPDSQRPSVFAQGRTAPKWKTRRLFLVPEYSTAGRIRAFEPASNPSCRSRWRLLLKLETPARALSRRCEKKLELFA
jgi:hypothetical protein